MNKDLENFIEKLIARGAKSVNNLGYLHKMKIVGHILEDKNIDDSLDFLTDSGDYKEFMKQFISLLKRDSFTTIVDVYDVLTDSAIKYYNDEIKEAFFEVFEKTQKEINDPFDEYEPNYEFELYKKNMQNIIKGIKNEQM